MGRTRAATALAVAGALVMSGGLVMLSAPTATAEPAKVHKSYVCKYVSIPGEAERLQTGDNPIWVDNHAIPGYDGSSVEVGDVFVDKHDKSVVIVANTLKLDPEPGVDECPGPVDNNPGTVPYQGIRENDPCGRGNDDLAIPTSPDSNGVTYVPSYDGLSWSVLITAPAGKTLAGENGATTKTVSGSFTDVPCASDEKKVVVCKYVGTPPGTAHHIIVVSVNAIKDFPANPTFPWTFADAQDSVAIRFAVGNEQPGDEELVNCPERRQSKTPAGITTTDPCGPNNVTWVAKADDFFDYTEKNGVVTASLKSPDQYVPSGQTSWRLADYEDNVPCPPGTVALPQPGVNDPCGAGNATWVVPPDDNTFRWSLVAGVLSVEIVKAGTTFPDESTTHNYGTAPDSDEPCILGAEKIAPTVTFADPTCAEPNRTTWQGNLTELVDYTQSARRLAGRASR